MLTDYLYETILSGGWVLLPILLVGALGFFLVGLVLLEIKGDFFHRDFKDFFKEVFDKLEQNDMPGVCRLLQSRPGMVAHSLQLAVNNRHMPEEALQNFGGCAVVISHDRWFLDRIATHILAFEGDSQVVFFQGNWSEYEADRRQRLGGEAVRPHPIKYRRLTR